MSKIQVQFDTESGSIVAVVNGELIDDVHYCSMSAMKDDYGMKPYARLHTKMKKDDMEMEKMMHFEHGESEAKVIEDASVKEDINQYFGVK